MRGRGAWGWAVAVLVGLGAGRGLAGDPVTGEDGPAKKGSWLPRWLGGGDKPAAKKPPPREEKKSGKGAAEAGRPANGLEEAALMRAREEAKLLRRLDACDKLRLISDQTSDAD